MYARNSEFTQTYLIISAPKTPFDKVFTTTIKDLWINTGHAPQNILNDTLTNPHGTPYLSSIVEQVELACPLTVPFVAYVKADILFDTGFFPTLKGVHDWMNASGELVEPLSNRSIREERKRVMLVGKRRNHPLLGFIHTNDLSSLTSEWDIPRAQDYFIMSRNLIDWTSLPNFVVGRVAYDNALVDWAYHHAYLIDATQTILALHQSTADGNRAWIQNTDIDMAFNAGQRDIIHDHGSTDNAHAQTRFVVTESSTTNTDERRYYVEVQQNLPV
jgi:hypothetical protein